MATHTPSFSDVERMGARFLSGATGPLMAVYGLLVLAEFGLAGALTLGATRWNPFGIFAPTSGPWHLDALLESGPGVFLIVAAFIFTGLLRTALYAPTRRIVLEGESLSAGQILGAAWSRVGGVLGAQQVIGLFGVFAWVMCQLVGAPLATIPQLLSVFALTPALYLAASGMRVGRASVAAIGWSRRHAGWIFGSQTALLCLALALESFVRQGWSGAEAGHGAAAAAASMGLVAFVTTYRFVEWAVTSTVWMAIEEAEARLTP